MQSSSTSSETKIEVTDFNTPKKEPGPLDKVAIGQFWWVLCKEWDEKKPTKKLYCVENIGSNHVAFTRSTVHGSTNVRVGFNEFETICTFEPQWEDKLKERMQSIQADMREAMKQLLNEGRKLHVLPAEASTQPTQEEQNTLPVLATDSPTKYKKELIAFEKKYPNKLKVIDELAKEFAVVAKDVALPDLVFLSIMKEKLNDVEDRIFTVELYCGLQEQVHQIADGAPAPEDTPITIRQMLLFMDEETLFNYESGGMDYSSLKRFDEWVVKPENLSRILPEPKGVVAFRVRRNDKDRGPSTSLGEAWYKMQEAMEDKKTYLLLRNGDRVYRLATEIDFSPRLIPFRKEIGEAQFVTTKVRYHEAPAYKKDGTPDKGFPFGRTEEEYDVKVTPDDLDYDKHVKLVDEKLKHYNRMIILLQGLLDRSTVFHPHPGIKLTTKRGVADWVKLIRDEEDGLPNNSITFEEYRAKCNKSLKTGCYIWSNWVPEDMGTWNRDFNHKYYSTLEGEVANRPLILKVESMKRDKSAVYVSWEVKRYHYGEYNAWGHWIDSHEAIHVRHMYIPIQNVLNVSAYQLGDYKMFLCDRALRGKYLEWANCILGAEEFKRQAEKENTK